MLYIKLYILGHRICYIFKLSMDITCMWLYYIRSFIIYLNIMMCLCDALFYRSNLTLTIARWTSFNDYRHRHKTIIQHLKKDLSKWKKLYSIFSIYSFHVESFAIWSLVAKHPVYLKIIEFEEKIFLQFDLCLDWHNMFKYFFKK